jgi:ribosomal protein S18 acetylase RimI-like enzyme
MSASTPLDTRARRATASDRTEIATTLSSAFYDDPIFTWGYPDAEFRRRILPDFFGTFADVFTPHGTTFLVESGVAMWSPAGVDSVPADQVDDFTGRLVELSGPHAERFGELMTVIDDSHPHDPCAYLQFVGVRAELQGRGTGSAVMAPMLAECDRDGIAAYLVSTSPRSRKLYERHGFRVVDELCVSDAPPMWAMWREPWNG